MKNLTVLKAKRFGIYSCLETDSLKSAAKLMTEHNISALVVVAADGSLRGIISRTDLVRACFERDDWPSETVRDYMNADVVTVTLDEPMTRVMELLIDKHIHRVVAVRDQDGATIPVGVLSAADVVYHMAQ